MTCEDYQQLEKGICNLRKDLDTLKTNWDKRYQRRSTGGIAAIRGFYCQFALYLLEVVKAYISHGDQFEDPHIFIESLSDIINSVNEKVVILTEVKRTLSSQSVSKALNQLWDIYDFSHTLTPNLCQKLHFRILSTRKELINVRHTIDNWSPDEGDWSKSRVKEFRERTEVEINARPEEQILSLLSNHLKAVRPREIIDRWLSILLRADGNFHQSALNIWEDIRELRFADIEKQKPDGIYVWSNYDMPPETVIKGNVITGRQPTVNDLREGYFANRDNVYVNIINKANSWIGETAEKESITRLPMFWIGGRSGCGKSVALLHTLASLYDFGRGPILHLGPKTDLIPLAINWARNIVIKESSDSPVIISVDDPYSPTSCQDAEKIWRKGLAGLEDLFQSGATKEIPILLCCGPTEQAERFRDDFYSEVGLTLYEMPVETKNDYEDLRSWYRIRVGKEPPGIGDENVLLIQLFFEWEVGSTIREFGNRFYNRIKDIDHESHISQQSENSMVSIVSKILSLNRFYTGYPEKAFDNYTTPEIEQHFSRLIDEHHHLEIQPSADRKGYWIAHPHLSNSIFESWYPPQRKIAIQREILLYAISDCLQFGINPSEQMAPLWALSQHIFNKDEQLNDRLPTDQAIKLLKSLYNKWPLAEDNEMSLAHLPVWIQLSVQCPDIGITPEPIDIAIKKINIGNLCERGLRLTCHKLLEHYHSLNLKKQKEVNESIYQLLFMAPDWVEWAAVAQDALFRTKELRYCSIIANWLNKNNLSKKTSNLLRAALRIFPNDSTLQETASTLLVNAGPEIAWGDIAIHLLENNFGKDSYDIALLWAEKYQEEFEICFLLGKLLLKNFDQTSKLAQLWLKRFHLEASANYVLEPYLKMTDEISGEIFEFCIKYIEKGHHTSERLLELLINKFPKDKTLRALGFNLLESINNETDSWFFLWKALIKAEADERVVELGRNWLNKRLLNNKSWGVIWEQLWNIQKTQRFALLGMKWIVNIQNFENSSWNHVWKALWSYHKDKSLSILGQKWLKSRMLDQGWGFVWTALWDTDKSEDLKLLGKKWLVLAPCDHGSWSHIWQRIWPYCKGAVLAEHGKKWLAQASCFNESWGNVWEKIWIYSKEDSLISSGKKWLSETTIADGSWWYVWRHIRKWNVTTGCQDQEITELGKKWIIHTPLDHKLWGYAWRCLWPISKNDILIDLGNSYLKKAKQEYPEYKKNYKFISEALKKYLASL